MKNKFIRTSLLLSLTFITQQNSSADEIIPTHSMKTNSQILYNKTPSSAENFSEMFSNGMLYSRLRSNTFYLDYKDSSGGTDSLVSALGASFIYKSAALNNFDFTAGAYFSIADFWNRGPDDNVANTGKGKDTLSRYNYVNYDNNYMAVLGQAYLRYRGIDKTEISLGRQLVETFYTASNDTKIIPNTFDALVVSTKTLPQTDIKLAYLKEQKLRDHTTAHSVLMYGDSNSSSKLNPEWDENDDSAMHNGLTYTALKAAGKPTDAPLIVADIKNSSVKNLNLNASFYSVPELISQSMVEGNYKFNFNGFSVSPGVRFIKQFDNGAGAIAGASLKGTLAGMSGANGGYKDAASLDSQMIAARVVTKIQNYSINLGYTNILDEADLVTPWRGFPTAGYTRSMARYNWRANTQSYRLEIVRNENKKGIYKDIYTQASILYTNADETKGGKDELYYYLGFVQNIPSLIELQWRLRVGYMKYIESADDNGNNLDARFELNYLF